MPLPYSLSAPTFPFKALTAVAGRLPIGGEREMALATLMAARLASGLLPPVPLCVSTRESRAAGARVWFSTLTLPASTRAPIARLVDATEGEDPGRVAAAMADVARATTQVLDRRSRAELAAIVAALERPALS